MCSDKHSTFQTVVLHQLYKNSSPQTDRIKPQALKKKIPIASKKIPIASSPGHFQLFNVA